MHKPQFIQIDIPNPCSQNWDEMTQNALGCHCTHCQKTVIDFTTWSDAALYNYFSKDTGHTCGMFLTSQLNRHINIPHQPHSRLYRMTVALGLALLFTQTPQLLAQTRPPVAQQLPAGDTTIKRDDAHNNHTGRISGQIVDDKREPMINAIIQVSQGGILKGGAIADYDGNYMIAPLYPGYYDVVVTYAGYDSSVYKRVVVSVDATTVNCQMSHSSSALKEYRVLGGAMGRQPFQNENNNVLLKSERVNRLTKLSTTLLAARTTNPEPATTYTIDNLLLPIIPEPINENPSKKTLTGKDIDHMPR